MEVTFKSNDAQLWWWPIGDVVAHWRYGGSLEIYGGSLEIWRLIGDMEAHWRCGGSLVAHQTSGQRSRVRIHLLPQWSWWAAGSLCYNVENLREERNTKPETKNFLSEESPWASWPCRWLAGRSLPPLQLGPCWTPQVLPTPTKVTIQTSTAL